MIISNGWYANGRRMAEGVGNAAVIIPFMTRQYEASTNCKLERKNLLLTLAISRTNFLRTLLTLRSFAVKFAQQTGVPIVPVMMQQDYTPHGWLGLLTAGLLWTPLHEKSSLEENADALLHQIMLTLSPDANLQPEELQVASEAADGADFSVSDLRDELQRLEQEVALSSSQPKQGNQGGGPAVVPASVPDLPRGILVTQSMTELLAHLTSSDKNRVALGTVGRVRMR